MKRILSIFLCLLIVILTLSSCGAPKIEEISDRLSELIEASYGVNEILFGKGPETYERVYDPKALMEYYEAEGGQRYYYYYLEDEEIGTVLAYRTKSYGDDYDYLLVCDEKDGTKTSVYEGDGKFYYSIEYTPVEHEFYYDDTMPSDYDVVVVGEEYSSVDVIKKYAETVYSAEYLASIYQTLFDGVMVSDDVENGILTARYLEYETESGEMWFMKSNTQEPLVTEKRIFDVSSAEIARGSKANRVRVEIDSYLESSPDKIDRIVLTLVKQDGVWMLDSGTY